MKNKRGITLIALVITIIILLVLAGVSLSLVLGDNGVLNKAQNATTETRNAEEKETIEMAVTAAQTIGHGKLITENLNSELGKVISNGTLGPETERGWSYSILDKRYNIDKTGKVEEQTSLLPKEYRQVEYIESSGTQYIDTGFKPNQDTRWVLDLNWTYQSVPNVCYVMGSRTYPNKNSRKMFGIGKWWSENNYNFYLGYNIDDPYVFNKDFYNKRHIFDVNKNILYVDDVPINTATYVEFSVPYSLFIFAINDDYNNAGVPIARSFVKTKLYSSKIYDNGKIERNFIPCKHQSDSKLGLYDLVEGKFYTN